MPNRTSKQRTGKKIKICREDVGNIPYNIASLSHFRSINRNKRYKNTEYKMANPSLPTGTGDSFVLRKRVETNFSDVTIIRILNSEDPGFLEDHPLKRPE